MVHSRESSEAVISRCSGTFQGGVCFFIFLHTVSSIVVACMDRRLH